MADKKKDKWAIDDWDDSLDSKVKEKPDPFSIPSGPSDDPDWGMPPEPKEKKEDKSKPKEEVRKSPKWLIPVVCGVCEDFALNSLC